MQEVPSCTKGLTLKQERDLWWWFYGARGTGSSWVRVEGNWRRAGIIYEGTCSSANTPLLLQIHFAVLILTLSEIMSQLTSKRGAVPCVGAPAALLFCKWLVLQ